MKKILVALDYDPSAQKVAERGYDLAKALNAQTILLHVTSDSTYYSSLNFSPIMGFEGFSNSYIVQADADEEVHKAAQTFLDKSKLYLGDEKIQTVVKNGGYGEAILSTAKELNVDIIVMGTHSRRGLEKILVGSVAEKVLQQTSIPVFIIPTRYLK